ncbi:MAG: YIP1 family protein [Pelosinus sp.]|nr:YIP1 family protein [Pelosinus sp.]
MNTIFENLYDVLFVPRKALRRIADERPFGQAVLVFLLSVLLPVIPLYFTMRGVSMHFAAGIIAGAELIGSLVMWFLSAAVWGLLAEFFGGNGRSSSLFAALGFAHVPRIFLVPGLMAVGLMPSAVKGIFEVALIAGVSIWSVILDVAAIRETYALSGAKAALVLLMPLLIVLIFIVLAVITAATMMIELPFSMQNVLME